MTRETFHGSKSFDSPHRQGQHEGLKISRIRELLVVSIYQAKIFLFKKSKQWKSHQKAFFLIKTNSFTKSKVFPENEIFHKKEFLPWTNIYH